MRRLCNKHLLSYVKKLLIVLLAHCPVRLQPTNMNPCHNDGLLGKCSGPFDCQTVSSADSIVDLDECQAGYKPSQVHFFSSDLAPPSRAFSQRYPAKARQGVLAGHLWMTGQPRTSPGQDSKTHPEICKIPSPSRIPVHGPAAHKVPLVEAVGSVAPKVVEALAEESAPTMTVKNHPRKICTFVIFHQREWVRVCVLKTILPTYCDYASLVSRNVFVQLRIFSQRASPVPSGCKIAFTFSKTSSFAGAFSATTSVAGLAWYSCVGPGRPTGSITIMCFPRG